MGEIQVKGLTIRKATLDDINDMMPVYQAAQKYMTENGNPNQWQKGFPDENVIRGEVIRGVSYLMLDGNNVVAAFSLVPGEDPTYGRFYGDEGEGWLNDEPYCTIHKLASNGKVKGIFDLLLEFALRVTDNLRADTHDDNKTMQHLLLSRGFRFTGIIHLANGSPRRAYHLVASQYHKYI